MSPHQTIAVAVRLFAVWLVIYVGRTAPSFYREAVRTDDFDARVVILLVAALTVALVLLLWFFPKTVARRLLDSKSLVAGEPVSIDTWFAVGCALLGLWLIVPALSSLIYHFAVQFMAQRNPEVEMSNANPTWVYWCAEIAFGVWLLLGAKGARKLFWWARNAN
jgi:hypothetical protein